MPSQSSLGEGSTTDFTQMQVHELNWSQQTTFLILGGRAVVAEVGAWLGVVKCLEYQNGRWNLCIKYRSASKASFNFPGFVR